MKKNKTLIQNSITYAIVIGAWALMTVLSSTGHMSSLMKGLLVPICIYVILAVSLNLTVGILGELSLGHAGFMCVGAFSGAFFTNCMENVIPSVGLRFPGSSFGRSSCRNIWNPHRNSGSETEGRLPGDCNPGFWRDYQKPDQCHVCGP